LIRAYRDADFPRVSEIHDSSKLDELRFETREFRLIPLFQDPKRLDLFGKSRLAVFETDAIRGFGGTIGNYISFLFVAPDSRGLGIGRRLAEYLIAGLAGPVELDVVKSNAPANALYAGLGFTLAKVHEVAYNGVPVMVNTLRLER
jgi:putative acetyltransferase